METPKLNKPVRKEGSAILTVEGSLEGRFQDILIPNMYGAFVAVVRVDTDTAATLAKTIDKLASGLKKSMKFNPLNGTVLKAQVKEWAGKGKGKVGLPVEFEDGTPITDEKWIKQDDPVRIECQLIPFDAKFGSGISCRLLSVTRLADGGEPEEPEGEE